MLVVLWFSVIQLLKYMVTMTQKVILTFSFYFKCSLSDVVMDRWMDGWMPLNVLCTDYCWTAGMTKTESHVISCLPVCRWNHVWLQSELSVTLLMRETETEWFAVRKWWKGFRQKSVLHLLLDIWRSRKQK